MNYVVAILVLLLLDFAWIGLFMGNKYKKMIDTIQSNTLSVNYLYAMLSYCLMVLGLVYFVLPKISKENCLSDCLKYAVLFGVILYGVYDFTAAAVIKDWNIGLAIIDIMWGGFVFFCAAYAGCYFSS